MSEMVERVARAIRKEGFAYKAANGGDDCNWSDIPDEVFARAAIEAMRDPTDAMLLDGFLAFEQDVSMGGEGHEPMLACYRAMIDAALAEEPK